MIAFRDKTAEKYGLDMLVYRNEEGIKQGINPFDHGSVYTDIMKTQALRQALAKYGFTATFFVVGDRIPGGDALAYMIEKGCEIGIHGYTHNFYYDTCEEEQYRSEIEKTAAAIEKAVPGYKIRLMRPVGGRISAERLAASPYSVIMWSIDSEDWRYKYSSGDTEASAAEKINTIVDNIMKDLEDGDVIEM
jgi:peptidoglycan/xylan/chitin deacetylase (PgdA/CDA1 family)